jgi:hypothetical protein
MLGQPYPVQHRSQNATDFGEQTAGTNMAGNGWTAIGTGTLLTAQFVASTASISGKRAELVKTTSSNSRILGWDRIATVADVEVLALIRILQDPGGTDETIAQINVRADPSDADPYYVCLPCEVSSVKKFEIGRGDGAGGGARLGNVNKSWAVNTNWWIRFRVIGNTQKGKMWAFQTPEPTTWENDFADSNVPSAGKVGLGMFYTDALYGVLWFSVATGGKTAPSPGG